MNFDFSRYADKLLFVPLGGSNEIGMNLNLYTIGGKWLMVDCGIGFAHEHLPGIEVIVPDVQFIAERKKDLLGLVITHAHEDHLGAVPYLWRELECPIYATPFTAALLKHKLGEMGAGKKPQIHEVAPGNAKFALGPFSLDFIGITHSIPEMQAVAITTDAGIVMHTGDWKFDEQPLVGEPSDYKKLEAYGDKGILAMVCDSTNVFVEGQAGSEEEVREHLTNTILRCKNRVVVTTFASNIARLKTVIEAAHAAGRVVSLAGRSMWRMIETAHESGYLTRETEFVSDREAMNLPKNDVLILCTGCQGEPRAALTRIAKDEHQALRLSPGDTVIYSSRKIPGNETAINWTVNQLVKKGVEVITDRDGHIHVSGHPARSELQRMYALVRPRIAIPTHGEARHLHEHAKLARSLGVKETVEASNGAVILLEKGEAGIVGRVPSGYQAVDGSSLIPTDGSVLKNRRRLRDDGCALISFALGSEGQLASAVKISTPGLLDEKEDADLLRECEAEAESALQGLRGRVSDEQARDAVRTALRRFLKRELDKKPPIEVHVMRV